MASERQWGQADWAGLSLRVKRGVMSSGVTHLTCCKGTAPVAVLNTHYRRKAGARNSSGSDFSSRGHWEKCLHSGHILKAEPTASLVGLDTGREREVRGR